MRHKVYKGIAIALLATATMQTDAKVVLPAIFSDNMIVQQKSCMLFSGTASPNSIVKIETGWSKKVLNTQSNNNGEWQLQVQTPKAGGPYNITFDDGERTTLNNVAVGEVWFCSGQSNMEMPIAGWGKVLNYEEEIKNANYPDIRLYQVKKTTAIKPVKEAVPTMGGWQECSPVTIPEFSSLAYFYARRLHKELGVPIGVIDCTWGGTPAESWTSSDALQHVWGYEEYMQQLAAVGFDEEKVMELYNKVSQEWKMQVADIDLGYKEQWQGIATDDNNWSEMQLPNYWETQNLQGFDGAVWFRKEIEIPADCAGKELQLSPGVIDDEDIVYWNGEQVAQGSGYNVQRHYTIPAEKVLAGRNTLCIRVFDTGGEGGIAGEAKEMFVSIDGKKLCSLSGPWKYRIGCSLASLPTAPVWPYSSWHPSALFNAMVSPWLNYPIKGVIWYQGCANVGRHEQYEVLFQSLIHDWRKQFNNPNMPFYFVQLANYLERKDVQPDSEWAALREAQAKALNIENTGMVGNIDLGEANDIHPKNKQEVGRRLAALSLANTYERKVAGSAPTYKGYIVKGNEIHIYFQLPQHAEPFSENSDIKGFTIAGADHRFYPAKAYTHNGKVIVSSPHVASPIAVRYGWADNPECNLYTPSGLIVAPFRSDNW